MLIEDLSDGSDASPGVDVDSIELMKGSGDGSRGFAFEVTAFMQGTQQPPAGADDPANALGEGNLNPASCEPGGHVSLGGPGGYIILQIEDGLSIEPGDFLSVIELGERDCVGVGDEIYRPSYSASAQVDSFEVLGEYSGGFQWVIR